jgi:hypothetical protein
VNASANSQASPEQSNPASAPAFSDDLGSSPLSLWQRVLVYIGVTAVAVLGFWVAVRRPYTPGSDLGYYMGLAGSCMMLSLLLYPLRKYWGRLHQFGSMKAWFVVHMVFGILGPILVLFHSTFQLRSFNASVAFWSMVAVLASGLVGRFLYVHIYKGLGGRHSSLYELEGYLESRADKTAHALDLAPHARDLLEDFRRQAFSKDSATIDQFKRFVIVSWRRAQVVRQSQSQVRKILRIHAKNQGWTKAKYLSEAQGICDLIEEYTRSVDLTSRLAFWERLLAWWQLAHVPVVYVLVLSAIAHVVAVHMY